MTTPESQQPLLQTLDRELATASLLLDPSKLLEDFLGPLIEDFLNTPLSSLTPLESPTLFPGAFTQDIPHCPTIASDSQAHQVPLPPSLTTPAMEQEHNICWACIMAPKWDES